MLFTYSYKAPHSSHQAPAMYTVIYIVSLSFAHVDSVRRDFFMALLVIELLFVERDIVRVDKDTNGTNQCAPNG
jgi:hypothetical protein